MRGAIRKRGCRDTRGVQGDPKMETSSCCQKGQKLEEPYESGGAPESARVYGTADS